MSCGLPRWLSGKESACNAGETEDMGSVRKIPWSRNWWSSVLAWRIPWTEEPGGLQSTGSHRVRGDRVTSLSSPLCLRHSCAQKESDNADYGDDGGSNRGTELSESRHTGWRDLLLRRPRSLSWKAFSRKSGRQLFCRYAKHWNHSLGFSGGSEVKKSMCQRRQHGFDPWVGTIPWRKKWQPTLVFLPGNILAWEIPWREGLGGLQSMGSQRVGHDLMTKQHHQTLQSLIYSLLLFRHSVVFDSTTPWTAARQASLSLSISWVCSVSCPFILCRPLLLSPSIFPSLRPFSSESALRIITMPHFFC